MQILEGNLHIIRENPFPKLQMARASGGVHRRCSSEKIEISDRSCLDMQDFHVLAVDDSFVDRKVIERLLKISSLQVTVVDSGKRALQLLGLDEEKSSVGSKGSKVHLIITDYSMPGMTGYELLKRVKESSLFNEIPVVIMSSENILTRINRCLEEGAKEYIVKPVKLADVKRLKESILIGHSSGVVKNDSFKPSLQEIQGFSSPTSLSSPSSSRNIDPLFLGYPCTTPQCVCISRHPRFCNRSSKYHSQLSLH